MNTITTMKYVIYCRKSTDSEDRQILSLDAQERELLEIAKKHDLNVVEIFRESRSAKSAGRPVFNEVLHLIEKGKVGAILCWKLDRLARNFVDGGKVIDLLQRGTIKEIRTHEAIHLPSDNVLMLAVQLGMANQYIRDLSENVKRGNREKLARGEWPNHAPLGYLNDKATRTIVVDKKKAKYVQRAFSLYLQSKTLREVADTMYTEGFRTRNGRKVFIGSIQRMLLNPFYMGIMKRDGKYYNGNHEPLISKVTFEKAQELSGNRSRPRPARLFFPLRGFLKCEVCGCALTASLKKGHQYYYCTNKKGPCDEHKHYMREIYLEEQFAKVLDGIKFSERKVELMYQSAKEELENQSDYYKKTLETLQKELQSLKSKESRLLDAFVDEQIPKEVYDERVLSLNNQKVSLKKEIARVEKQQPAFRLEPTKDVFLRASRAKKEFLKADDSQKREILENLCWNLSFQNKKVAQVSLKSPYDIMFRAPKNAPISILLGDRDSNPN